MNITICGGGSQGHISTGVIGSNPNYIVNVLTRRPNLWSHDFYTVDLSGKRYDAKINIITDKPEEVIPESDIIMICLPGYAIREEIEKIRPYVKTTAIVGCAFGGSGFFIHALEILGTSAKTFAFQRVPYTGRPKEYGHSAQLKGYKPYLKVATTNIEDMDALVKILENWYHTPVYKLSHYLEATLSNSNPLLHPCRLYILFKDWTPDTIYHHIPCLYDTDWDDESSKLWVACDNELRSVLKKLPVVIEEIPSVLEYYGCQDTNALTLKMQSIEPFKGVQPHMTEVDGGYQLDNKHRYFIEDIPYGIVMIKSFAELVGVSTPNIDRVILWAQKLMGKEYLVDGKLTGKDLDEACVARHITE